MFLCRNRSVLSRSGSSIANDMQSNSNAGDPADGGKRQQSCLYLFPIGRVHAESTTRLSEYIVG